MIPIYHPEKWNDYELIDCGACKKLERFGSLILIRPEPQAIWNSVLSDEEWGKMAHIEFQGRSATSGEWKKKQSSIPERWTISWKNELISFELKLALTSFKHLGVFPEQAVNWDYLAKAIRALNVPSPRFLNLFAYTGAASLAARAAGADVCHVDSIKQVVNWANENQLLSKLSDIRWIVEDALKFVKRELRRGKTYHGIILDPPAYGNGPNGEKWKLEEQLNEMLHDVCQLLDPARHFLILNTYSLGFSSLIVENLLHEAYNGTAKPTCGELYLESRTGLKLPLGVIGRLKNF